MPHTRSYGPDKFTFFGARILVSFKLQTLISSVSGSLSISNSLGCNFRAGRSENIEILGSFKPSEALKHPLDHKVTFIDLARMHPVTENASE